jgi:hypothetical protein
MLEYCLFICFPRDPISEKRPEFFSKKIETNPVQNKERILKNTQNNIL